jgi:hypothetical protein
MLQVVIFGVPYTPDYWTTSPVNSALTVIFSIFPWDLLMKGVQDLGKAVASGDKLGEHIATVPWLFCVGAYGM